MTSPNQSQPSANRARRGDESRVRGPAFAPILPAAAALLVGCVQPATQLGLPEYVPDTAGLVRQTESAGQDMRFVLADGRVLTFPANGNYIGGTMPPADAVLVAGTQPVPWIYRVDLRQSSPNLTPEGCYMIFGTATQDATHVFQPVHDPRGDIIIVFPKTADWTDEGYDYQSGDMIGAGTCINPQGKAFHFGF